MKDATTLDTPSSSTFTEFNVRLDKGKPHFIRLNDSVVRDLERQLARGGEQSGILFGSIEGIDKCTIAVEGFETAVKVDDRIRAGGVRKIVGTYRSHSRPDFALELSDRALFQRCFAKEARLLLLVKPAKTDIGTAMFLLGENGQLTIDRATVEFPFNLRELGAEEPPPAPVPLVAVVKPSGGGKVWKLGAVGVAVIASVMGLNGLRVFDGPTPQPQQTVAEKEIMPAVEPPAPAVVPKPTEPAPVPAKVVKTQAPARKLVETPRAQPVSVAENIVQTPPPQIAQPRAVVPTPALPAVSAPLAPAVTPAPMPRAVEPVIAVTPPRATRQFAPTVSDKVRQSITGEVVVKVRVNVDEAGKVTAAESLSGGNSVADALVGSAISAVKKWQFEPARRGDEKVAGDLVLSFTFRK